MGRYDKIKVYDGSNWVRPNRIRVRQGSSWVDLGIHTSDNNKELYVYQGTVPKRATLTKNVIKHTGHKFKNGDFQAEPTNGYCYCPKSSYGGATFKFQAYIKRGSDGAKNIFHSYGINVPTNYIRITLNADNTITVDEGCDVPGAKGSKSGTTSAKINPDAWNLVEVWADKGTSTLNVRINGTNHKITGAGWTWLFWSTNYVGAAGLYIREDGFLIQSIDGNMSPHSTSYVPVNNDESYEETVWK